MLLGAHLVAKNAVTSQVVWLVDVRTGSHPKASHTLPASHDTTCALAFQWRGFVDWAPERVLALDWVCSAYHLLWKFVVACQSTWLVWLHLVLTEVLGRMRCVIRSLICF